MPLEGRRLGIALLADGACDLAFAEETARAAVAALERAGAEIAGPRDLLIGEEALRQAIGALSGQRLDGLVLVQASHAAPEAALGIARAVEAPLVLWAFPEQRTGGRLRLNSFSGMNAAGHALSRAGLAFRYLYSDPRVRDVDLAIAEALDGRAEVLGEGETVEPDLPAGERIAAALEEARVELVAPGGAVSAADAALVAELTGVQIATGELDGLLRAVTAIHDGEALDVRERWADDLHGLEVLEAGALDRCSRLHAVLKDRAEQADIHAFALTRKTGDTFSCAPQGALSMLADDGLSCTDADDLPGLATLLMLKAVAGEPPLLASLVDIDPADNSAVFWNCGIAPPSLADPTTPPAAGLHPVSGLPLVAEFALKPGPVTVARLSRSREQARLVLGSGEMLERPGSFSGISGVVRLTRPAREVLSVVMDEGLENSFALAYGDHRAALAGWAARNAVPLVWLG